jgi:hypothetical protein
MPIVDLVCLASSNKMRGRCIAGLRIDGKGWVRPIASDTDHGQLYFQHMRLDDGSEPGVLDVIGVDLASPKPAPGQPENWLIGKRGWALRTRPAGPELNPLLHSALVTGPALLGSGEGRVAENAAIGATASLALVSPSRLRFYLGRDRYRHLQPRAVFDLNGGRYDLPITDPAWTTRIVRELSRMAEPVKAHPLTSVDEIKKRILSGQGLKATEAAEEVMGIPGSSTVLLAASLGEAFNGYCYKLVAGVIVLASLT